MFFEMASKMNFENYLCFVSVRNMCFGIKNMDGGGLKLIFKNYLYFVSVRNLRFGINNLDGGGLKLIFKNYLCFVSVRIMCFGLFFVFLEGLELNFCVFRGSRAQFLCFFPVKTFSWWFAPTILLLSEFYSIAAKVATIQRKQEIVANRVIVSSKAAS
jgi:hypothetical protein